MFTPTSVFSWKNYISLCPISFCTPRPNLPVTPGVSDLCGGLSAEDAVWSAMGMFKRPEYMQEV